MDKLLKLCSLCKCSVNISINKHRDCYQSINDAVAEYLVFNEDVDEEDMKILDKIIEMDNFVDIQFYPRTPVGFYRTIHYDLEMALDEALECVEYEYGL